MKQLSGSAWEKIIGPTPRIGPFCQIPAPFDSIIWHYIITGILLLPLWLKCLCSSHISEYSNHPLLQCLFWFHDICIPLSPLSEGALMCTRLRSHVLDTIFKMSISISRYLFYFFTSIKCVREGRGATCEHFLPTYANMSSGQNRGLSVVGNIWIFDQGHEKGTVGDIGGEEGKIWLNLSHHLLLQGSTELLVLALDTKHPEPFLVGSLTTDMNFQNYRVTPCCSIPV